MTAVDLKRWKPANAWKTFCALSSEANRPAGIPMFPAVRRASVYAGHANQLFGMRDRELTPEQRVEQTDERNERATAQP